MNRSDFSQALGLRAGGLLLLNPYVCKAAIKIYDSYINGLADAADISRKAPF